MNIIFGLNLNLINNSLNSNIKRKKRQHGKKLSKIKNLDKKSSVKMIKRLSGPIISKQMIKKPNN